MDNRHRGNERSAFTLIEMIVTMAIAAIPILAVCTLLLGGQKGWQDSYDAVHKEIQQDALATMTTFGTIGRQSNRMNYRVYRISGGTFTQAVPPMGSTVARGQAVEMRYWDDGFDASGISMDTLETTNTGTHYALFYLDGDDLKVDFGQVANDIGGVSGGARVTTGLIQTQVLAHDVDTATNDEVFAHTVIGGEGQGSVRMDLTLRDSDGQTVEVKTATLLRIVWPR